MGSRREGAREEGGGSAGSSSPWRTGRSDSRRPVPGRTIEQTFGGQAPPPPAARPRAHTPSQCERGQMWDSLPRIGERCRLPQVTPIVERMQPRSTPPTTNRAGSIQVPAQPPASDQDPARPGRSQLPTLEDRVQALEVAVVNLTDQLALFVAGFPVFADEVKDLIEERTR